MSPSSSRRAALRLAAAAPAGALAARDAAAAIAADPAVPAVAPAWPWAGGAAPSPLDRAEWAAFRARFLAPDGRVVDTGNADVSHSEGQGWGLLLAERHDDRDGFDRILAWTRRTLARPGDALHAWRYRPGAARPVDDPNNATDGDLFIAWALLRAAERWGVADHAALGRQVAADVLRLLVRQAGPLPVLLPGARGFVRADHVVVNPSYYAFPAFRTLARAVPDPAWARVAAGGLLLLRGARFGRWSLPPDWLAVAGNGAATPAPGWPPRFSYDAVRVPLYLAWAGLADEPALTGPAGFWTDPAHRYLPAWTEFDRNTVSPYPAAAGVGAVARLTVATARGRPDPAAGLPPVSAATDYYAAALVLLARTAAAESRPGRP